MNDDAFKRLRALYPDAIDAAQALAASAVAALPDDLQPAEEPAHVYEAVNRRADDSKDRT